MKKFVLFFLLSFIFLMNTCPIYNSNSFAENNINLPIIMYHSILKSKTGKYITSPEKFKNDLLWLKENGYTSVFLNDIKNYCEGKSDLPEKPVVISFDDGHYNNFFYAYPILKELGFKANINIIGCHSEYSSNNDKDNPNYSHLTWTEIKELKDSGIFEIGNHTYNMHQFKPRYGIAKMYNESNECYKQNLTNDVMKLENKFRENCNFNTNIFAFPFGKYSNESIEILSNLGFKIFLTCNEKINHLQFGQIDELKNLGRFNRNGLLSTKEFFKTINL